MLEQLGPGLWEGCRSIRLAGPLRIPRRMTVIRLEDGSLWVCSPNRLDDETRADLAALGPVRHLVAPNCFHHFFQDQYQDAYPEARLHGAPGLAAKRSDLRFTATLTPEPPAEWAGQIDQLFVEGVPKINETAFFHRASKTLVLTDLAFMVGSEQPFLSRLMFRATGVYQRFAPSRLFRLFVKDKAAVHAAIERIAQWDFERILVSHGQIVSGTPATLREAFAPYFP